MSGEKDYEKLYSQHLKDSYRDGNYLHARCLFCKRPGFVARLYDGIWHCKGCGLRGNHEQFEERLNTRLPLAEGFSGPQPTDPPMKTATPSPEVMEEGTQEQASGDVHARAWVLPPGRKLLSRTVQKRQVKRLRTIHRMIIERWLAGQSQKHIAEELGVSYQWVSIVVNSPIVVDEMERRLQERSAKLDEWIVDQQWNSAVREKMEELEARSRRITRKYKPRFRTRSRYENERYEEVERSVREAIREGTGE